MAKRKKKKSKAICLACGSKMKGRDVACRRCGQARAGAFLSQPGAAKALFKPLGAPAFVAKAARPRCGRCSQTSQAGARHCTTCGAPLLALVKSSGDPRRDVLTAKFRAEDNPEWREAYWRELHPEIYRNGGTAS